MPLDRFTFPDKITMDSLPDLLAFHRATFGGFRMEDGGDGEGDKEKSGDKGAGDFTAITSQADLDRIIGTRLARERESKADYDDLKKKATEYDKAMEAARTDQEKAVDAARKEGETAALDRANVRLVSAEARALAAEAKFRNPSLAARSIDLKDVKVNDDGSVDADAVKAKLKALSDSDPYLVDDGKKPAPKPDQSQGGGRGTARGKLQDLDGDSLYDRLHPKKTS